MSANSREVPLNLSGAKYEAQTNNRSWRLEQKSMRALLSILEDAPVGIELWDGQIIKGCIGEPEIWINVKNRKALWAMILNPDFYVGEGYSIGTLQIEGDLLRLIELSSNQRPNMSKKFVWLKKLIDISHVAHANTLSGSKSNIHHHYDLSNDFYRMWLDRDYMQYTCAYYQGRDKTLEQAQRAKLDHVCKKLRLQPGDEVVEAGCGWGGLALYMAEEYGARVRAYNISAEQVKYARDKAEQRGLTDRVTYIKDDYRNIQSECDVFVSVGMLEHVGVSNYQELGGVIDRNLRPDGRGLIHTIGRNKPRKMNQWIEKRIFPGAHPPTLKEMSSIFEPYRFSILDVENLRVHYAKTLQGWLDRYEQNKEKVAEMFDESFVRAWRFYLSGSIVAFNMGELQLFQVMFQRGDCNEVAWTRDHIYKPMR